MGLSSKSGGGLIIPTPLAGPDVLTGVLMGQRQGSESEKAMQLLLETEIQHVADGGKATRSREPRKQILPWRSQKETALLTPDVSTISLDSDF